MSDAFDPALAERLGADDYGMRRYVLAILKSGPTQMEAGPERDALFAGHMATIQRLAGEGKLAVAGPFGPNDLEFRGIFVLNVATVDEARALVENDPTVQAGVFVVELLPWYGSAALGVVNETHSRIQRRSF